MYTVLLVIENTSVCHALLSKIKKKKTKSVSYFPKVLQFGFEQKRFKYYDIKDLHNIAKQTNLIHY